MVVTIIHLIFGILMPAIVVKYIQLGYLFDQMGLKKIGISNIRIYANVQNPFTFAKEKLVDPESRGQRGSYPLVKTYSLGLSLNF